MIASCPSSPPKARAHVLHVRVEIRHEHAHELQQLLVAAPSHRPLHPRRLRAAPPLAFWNHFATVNRNMLRTIGFVQKSSHPGLETLVPVRRHRVRRQRDDRARAVRRAQLPRRFVAVDDGHLHVHHDHVIRHAALSASRTRASASWPSTAISTSASAADRMKPMNRRLSSPSSTSRIRAPGAAAP
jgi:hypothetical protein